MMKLDQNSFLEDNRGERFSPWTSYSDMFCSLMMVFILLFVFILLQYVGLQAQDALKLAAARTESEEANALLSQRDEENIRLNALLTKQNEENGRLNTAMVSMAAELEDIRTALATTDEEAQTAYAALATSQDELTQTRSILTDTQVKLDDAQSKLITVRSELMTTEQELASAQRELNAKNKQLSEKDNQLKTSQANEQKWQAKAASLEADLNALRAKDETEIEDTQDRLEQIVGLRLNIIEEISRALSEADILATVDSQSGAITLQGEMLFARGSSELNASGREVLNSFFPIYFRILSEGKYSDSISQITIEGHTDSSAGYLDNMTLSMRRAQSVLEYCYGMMKSEAERSAFVRLVNASGCSYSKLKLNNGVEDAAASRRVEIKFSLKDQEMIEEMAKIVGH